MTANLAIVLLTLATLCAVGFWLYRRGRGAERTDAAEASNEVKDRQLQAAADAPKTKGELMDRLRDGGGL